MHDELGVMVAPLEEASIIGSLMVGITSNSVTDEFHAIQVIESALSEYFFYGREVFDKKRKMFLEIIEELDLALWIPARGLRSWDMCLNSYKTTSRRYEQVRDARETCDTRGCVFTSCASEAKSALPAITATTLVM